MTALGCSYTGCLVLSQPTHTSRSSFLSASLNTAEQPPLADVASANGYVRPAACYEPPLNFDGRMHLISSLPISSILILSKLATRRNDARSGARVGSKGLTGLSIFHCFISPPNSRSGAVMQERELAWGPRA